MVEELRALRVNLDDGFYVLIVPNGAYHEFLLGHDAYAPIENMFGCSVKSDEEAIELAVGNAPEYIAWYIEDHMIES